MIEGEYTLRDGRIIGLETANIYQAERRLTTMLKRWDERPDPLEIRSLLLRYNITSQTVRTAAENLGMSVPDMQQIFEELRYLLPLTHQVVDSLVIEHGNDAILFAGRDGDFLFDAFSTKYPDKRATLLPGSTDIWYAEGLKDPTIARRFLETYGITEDVIKERKKIVLVDSGFFGSIGEHVRDLISKTYNIPLNEVISLVETKLVSSTHYCAENTSQICDYSERIISHNDLEHFFQRGHFAQYGIYGSNNIGQLMVDEHFSRSFATSLQVLPHFHQSYSAVKERYGRIIGVPSEQTVSHTFDQSRLGRSINASFVHPVAALMVQVETIRYMLGLP